MPLMHRKTPAAFKRNIEIEMEHGKPQKQAVAIAYSEKRKAQHKSHGGCMGPECSGCSDPSCYAQGGKVNEDSGETGHEKGVHTANYEGPGSSMSGSLLRSNTSVPKKQRESWAKEEHGRVLGEMKSMKKPNLYAQGGKVDDDKEVEDAADFDLESKRLHEDDPSTEDQTAANEKEPYLLAEGGDVGPTLGSMIGYPGVPSTVKKARGGEIHEDADQDEALIDDEMKDMMADELMAALDSKDEKRVRECIEAMVLSAMDRE